MTNTENKGKWIKIFENPYTNGYICSICGHKIQVTEQFLPEVTDCEVCGADMRGVETENPQKEDCGKWIIHEDFNTGCRYGCNQCGNLANVPSNFCPNCGKRMLKGAEK